MAQLGETSKCDLEIIHVDVLIPVHNACETIQCTLESVLNQEVPSHLHEFYVNRHLNIALCCFDDGSTDGSLELLKAFQKRHFERENSKSQNIVITMLIQSSGKSLGSAIARNRAAQFRTRQSDNHSLIWLDSDDEMHIHRIAEQICALLQSPDRQRLLLGSRFDRYPPNSTWHYAEWANSLTDHRLMLERYREVTVLQPTWCMLRSRFEYLNGYIEAKTESEFNESGILTLCHRDETCQSIRLAEDLRFFHAHIHANGILHVIPQKLLVYRHRAGQSQSSQTSRKLLLQLRALALEINVLRKWSKFVIWGAGRDGKELVKSLSEETRAKIVCMVDVDYKKIECGEYHNHDANIRIPIVHFSLLARNPTVRNELQEAYYAQVDQIRGRITKGSPSAVNPPTGESPPRVPPRKKLKLHATPKISLEELPNLPVVVCVAMYRTNGVLESNVAQIDRIEGQDLWHFS